MNDATRSADDTRQSLAPSELAALTLTNSDYALAEEIHHRFSRLEGSQHIASPTSLRWFAALLRTYRPKKILELGAGIGTMTEMMLLPEFKVSQIYTTESNPFCLTALDQNLSRRNDPRLTILTSEQDLLKINAPLDLIVGDGGFYSPLEFRKAREGTLLFFEGSRTKLRSVAAQTLAEKNLMCDFKQLGVSGKFWQFKSFFGIPIPLRVKVRDSCWIAIVRTHLPG